MAAALSSAEKIGLKALAKVVLNDEDGKIKKSGKQIPLETTDETLGYGNVGGSENSSAQFIFRGVIRFPLVIDETGQASTFLKYREGNHINVCDPLEMETEKVRRSIIGAIRFHKFLTLDMMDNDMTKTIKEKFDEIQKGLLDSILDRSILEDEKYLKLVEKRDGSDYDVVNFNEHLIKDHFKLIIVKQGTAPCEELMKKMYVVHIE